MIDQDTDRLNQFENGLRSESKAGIYTDLATSIAKDVLPAIIQGYNDHAEEQFTYSQCCKEALTAGRFFAMECISFVNVVIDNVEEHKE